MDLPSAVAVADAAAEYLLQLVAGVDIALAPGGLVVAEVVVAAAESHC